MPALGERPPRGPADDRAVQDPADDSEPDSSCAAALRSAEAARAAAAMACAARAAMAGSGRPSARAAKRVSSCLASRFLSRLPGRLRWPSDLASMELWVLGAANQRARTKRLQTGGSTRGGRGGEEKTESSSCRDQVVRAAPGGQGRGVTEARLTRPCALPRKAVMHHHRPNREGTCVGTGCQPNSEGALVRAWVVPGRALAGRASGCTQCGRCRIPSAPRMGCNAIVSPPGQVPGRGPQTSQVSRSLNT